MKIGLFDGYIKSNRIKNKERGWRAIIISNLLFAMQLLVLSACAKCTSEDFRFAMGNSDVPVGGYTQKIFEHYGIDEESVKGHISYGSNVKEVTTAISEGTVDCGIVYATDAASENLKVVDSADEKMCGRVLYPAAILKDAENRIAAEHFLLYLQTEEAQDVFAKVGFTNLSARQNMQDARGDSGEILIFAAASMAETLTDISEKYEEVAPDVKLVFNFDSSGTLKTQIEEGASCDIFISASSKQMNQLDITCDEKNNTDRLDYIDSETRIDILENKVVLCVNEDSKYKIDSFEDLFKALKEM